MRIGYLCSGIGCNILADLANGHEPVFACDIEPFPCEVLRQRKAEWFPGLDVIESDLKTYDFSRYKGKISCLSFGFPCQDLSGIGSGLGLDGARSGILWDCLRILGELRCEYAFIENVTDLIPNGLDRLLCELARMGYNARWITLSAAATGASHGRDRVWILAHAMQDGLEGKLRGGAEERSTLRGGSDVQAMADSTQDGLKRESASGLWGGQNDYWYDADGCLRDPPGREDRAGWERAADHGSPEPGVHRMVDAPSLALDKAGLDYLHEIKNKSTSNGAQDHGAHKVLRDMREDRTAGRTSQRRDHGEQSEEQLGKGLQDTPRDAAQRNGREQQKGRLGSPCKEAELQDMRDGVSTAKNKGEQGLPLLPSSNVCNCAQSQMERQKKNTLLPMVQKDISVQTKTRLDVFKELREQIGTGQEAWPMVKDRIAAIGNGQDVLACAVAWAILGGPVTSV